MAQVSLSAQQIEIRDVYYSKYRNALDDLRDLHLKTGQLIKNAAKGELEKFQHSKSTDAQRKATLEVEKSKTKIQEKLQLFQNQYQGQDKLHEVVTKALAQFYDEIKEAQTSFNESMKKAGDALQVVIRGVYTDPKYEITGLKDSHLNLVKDAWKTFHEELRDGINCCVAGSGFYSEAAHATRIFQSARDDLLIGLGGLGNDEYETAVTQAVAEFQKSVASAQANFCETIDTLVKEQKVKEKAVKKPLENSSALDKLVHDVAKIAQRLDNLEGKMEEILKNVKVKNDK